jgi:hypothetical protein
VAHCLGWRGHCDGLRDDVEKFDDGSSLQFSGMEDLLIDVSCDYVDIFD